MEYTYEGIKTEIKTKLGLLTNWQRTLFFGVYENLISAISYGINRKCVYPAEVFFAESFLKTATKYSSVIPRAKYLSYTEHRKKGAVGELLLTADPTFSDAYTYTGQSVIIDKWQEFTDATGEVNVFCTEQTIYYTLAQGNLDIPVKEGTPKEFNYVATGLDNEVFTLHSNSVDNDTISVHIIDSNDTILFDVNIVGIDTDEDKLFFVSDLVNYTCAIENAYDFESITLTFGDGVNTKKLNPGDIVLVKYADTKGSRGNVTNTDTVTSIKGTLLDALGDEAVLYVNNTEAISDGSEVESVESIKENATNLFGTGYRAGGYSDWTYILDAHSEIHKSIIWSTDDVADDTITTDQNKIFVTAISADGDELTQAQKDTITIDYLKDKKSPCEVISWQDLNVIYAIFRGEAVVETLSFPVITSQINEELEASYHILNTDFKSSIYESNFVKTIDSNIYVLRHVTQIYHMEKEFIYNTLNHVVLTSVLSSEESDPENQVYIQEDSLELWVQYGTDAPIKVAEDISGSWVEYNNTYVDISLGSNKVGTDATGLANDATVYTASTEVTGGGAQPILITGSNAQTINDLVTEIQADVTGIDVTFNDGDNYIRLSVNVSGDSTITFTDTDLISSLLSGAASVGIPINGKKYTVTNKSIIYASNEVSFTVTDLSSTPPDDYDLNLIYITKDGNDEQNNDIRLKAFNLITSTDDDFNTFDMEYE